MSVPAHRIHMLSHSQQHPLFLKQGQASITVYVVRVSLRPDVTVVRLLKACSSCCTRHVTRTCNKTHCPVACRPSVAACGAAQSLAAVQVEKASAWLCHHPSESPMCNQASHVCVPMRSLCPFHTVHPQFAIAKLQCMQHNTH
jgi:hypothetical protein